MAGQTHRSDPSVLSRRTLRHDHRRLADRLRPGMTVLDVGCGTGAITIGIARAVGPAGTVVGIDRDESLLEIARRDHQGVSNLRFEHRDAGSLELVGLFDIVTAARTLQWIAEPGAALARMARAVKAGGELIVLDYDHVAHAWTPDPPPAFVRVHDAFLAWRAANGWDNRMAEHLPGLFEAAGLADVVSEDSDEIARRGEVGFDAAHDIWTQVIEIIGPRIVGAGLLTEAERLAAEENYRLYAQTDLARQHLSMKTVRGVWRG
jgi:SAM-dependent methyltransferase